MITEKAEETFNLNPSPAIVNDAMDILIINRIYYTMLLDDIKVYPLTIIEDRIPQFRNNYQHTKQENQGKPVCEKE